MTFVALFWPSLALAESREAQRALWEGDGIQEMKSALELYPRTRREYHTLVTDARRQIALEHRSLFEEIEPGRD
jgi:hypothetical protein